jgi:spore germination cell wall hydrolase CwlJ-like protein
VPETVSVQLLEQERPELRLLEWHYYATTMPKAPTWVKGAKETLKLGHHVFFKDVP